jgi:hypothetical protein
MGRFFLCDLKRIFGSRATAVLCILVPFAVMLLFASVVAPLLVTRSRVSSSCFGICNDDDSDVTSQFIDFVANSESFKGVVTIYTVDSLDEGLGLVKDGEISGLLHIPKDFFKDISAGSDVKLDLYGNEYHTLECSLVLVAVQAALDSVGQAQNALNEMRVFAVQMGASQADADAFYNDLLSTGVQVVTDRRSVLGEEGFVSPAGGYLPAEFCLSAMLAWFLALAMLPLSGFSAADFSASVLERCMRTGGMRARFLSARLLSGALFLLTVTLLVFPVGLGASGIDRMFHGSMPALLASMGLMALSFSAMSLGLSAWMPNADAAVWAGFWLVVVLAMAGGAAIPESMLPEWVKALGQWSPVRSAMRLLAGSIFSFNTPSYIVDMLKTALWGLIGAVAAAAGFLRKAAA